MSARVKRQSYVVDLHSQPLARPISDDLMQAFMIGAEQERRVRAPVVSANLSTNTLDLTGGVDAPGAAEALTVAMAAFERARRNARLRRLMVSEVTVEIRTRAGLMRQELISGAEVGRRIGVSRQRVSQLATTSRFPKPVANVGGYLVWRWGDIADWAALHRRRTRKRRLARSA